jgi:carboxylesterase type B
LKASEPIEPWGGLYNATQEGSMCIQPDAEDEEISEDCLKLNVYTNDLYAHLSTAPKRPVLVYIPGGGFYIGSGSFKYHAGPENLMDHDIVFVAINRY